MLSELQPMGLTAAALRLDLDPFEVIRILVAGDGVPADLMFAAQAVDALGAAAGIEPSWWDGRDLPDDENPLRQRVRGALALLLERGHVGQPGTRQDNVWRGLPREDQGLLRRAVSALAEEGHLTLTATKLGTWVAITPASEAAVRGLANGSTESTALSELYEG